MFGRTVDSVFAGVAASATVTATRGEIANEST